MQSIRPPDKFNMVDMEGIDLLAVQGEEVPGLYNKLVESIALCRYQCVYNWAFNSILIPPTYVEMEEREDGVWINEGVMVDEEDVVHIASIEPEPPPPVLPVIESISITENGVYQVPEGVDGFNPVTVNIPSVGDYCRVCVVGNNSELLYDSYFASNSAVNIHEYILYEGVFHVLDLSISSIQSSYTYQASNLPVAQSRFTIRQLLNVVNLEAVGVNLKFSIPFDNSVSGVVIVGQVDCVIQYNNYRYRQCGRCTHAATLPTIQTGGAGRTYYNSPANGAEFTIPAVSGQDFFISGQATLSTNYVIIKNFFVE